MSTISEVWDSFTKSTKERINSPLYGAFIISWLTCNWDLIFTALFIDSNRSGWDKLYYIQANLSDYWDTIIYPSIMTLLILVIVPFIRIEAVALSERFKIRRDKVLEAMDEKKWLSPVEVKEFLKKYRESEDNYEKDIERKDRLLASLQKKYDKVLIDSPEIKELEEQSTELKNKLSESNDSIQVLELENKALKNKIEENLKELSAIHDLVDFGDNNIKELSKKNKEIIAKNNALSLKVDQLNEILDSKNDVIKKDKNTALFNSEIAPELWDKIIDSESLRSFYNNFSVNVIQPTYHFPAGVIHFMKKHELIYDGVDNGRKVFKISSVGQQVLTKLKEEYHFSSGRFVQNK